MSQISRLKDAEISNGNLINADDIDAEFNQLIAESNSQDTRLTNIESNAVTLTGVKTFSSNPKMNGIDERTAASGVTIDSVRCKDGMVKISGTPTEGGEIGYASNRLSYHNGTSVITLPDYGFISTVESRSSNTILAVADLGKVLVCTSTFTQTLTAAATLTSGWFAHIRNDGTGIIKIDPNASETIDGLTTIALYPGEAFSIVCDGVNFKTIGRSKGHILIQSQTASSVASVDFTTGIDSTFDEYILSVVDYVPTTDATDLLLRVTENSGSSWAAGASDYRYFGTNANAGGVATGTGSTGTTSAKLNFHALDNGISSDFHIKMYNPAGTSYAKKFIVDGNEASNTVTAARTLGGIVYQGTTNAINGIRFLSSSGNIASGTFNLYGVRK